MKPELNRNYNKKHQDKPVVSLATGKLPPQALEFEEAILGSLMIDRATVDELFQIFNSSEVFYKPEHQYIFQAIKDLIDASSPVDLLTVSHQLKINGTLSAAGGDMVLIQLTQKVSSGAHIEFWARVVLQMYIKRQLIAMCSECMAMAFDEDVDTFALMDHIDVETVALNSIIAKGRTELTYADALNTVAEKVKILTESDEATLTGVPTGFKKIDRHFGGWQKTDFIVIAARPGMGKTAFVVRAAVESAKAGFPVGFISLEMSTEQLATRTIAVESNFHLNQLTKSGFEKPEYFGALLKKIHVMRNLPIYIDDRPSLTIGEIKRKARLLKRKNKIELLIVDYIQLVGAEGNEDVRVRVARISNGLKALAKELEIPVIGLAQVSREAERTPHKRPGLKDLKESGDIEQDADAVCFLFRPAYYGLDVDTDVIDGDCNTEFIVAKYRHGGIGTIGLHFDENKTKFSDNDQHDDVEDSHSERPLPAMSAAEAFASNNPESDVPF